MKNKLEYRVTERNSICRLCRKNIKRNTEKVILFEPCMRNCQTVILCDNCVNKIYKKMKGKE